jgi:hypothetical protein
MLGRAPQGADLVAGVIRFWRRLFRPRWMLTIRWEVSWLTAPYDHGSTFPFLWLARLAQLHALYEIRPRAEARVLSATITRIP